jgi:hypothetical protein
MVALGMRPLARRPMVVKIRSKKAAVLKRRWTK